ncbi:hypothetical protein, partial [Helicobacter ganmani]|uniref:hypothetical protein n=1 Tax=Helicobacter ganmani TaxID=60246 RepID=UPI003A84EE86
MSVEAQINQFIQMAKSNIESHLSKERPNILVISYYPTYRKHYGNLITRLKEKYNVITIVERELKDEFERSGHHNVFFPWRITENGQTYYLNTDISGIDLILTADQVGYENGKIDRTFLSTTAKRIYFPHSLIEQTGACEVVDYILVPSKVAMKEFKKALPKSKVKLLESGYPKLDNAIFAYDYKPSNTITYAPSLRYGTGSNANNNLLSGFENMMATLGFTVQLYCDFSGYSDMAIGYNISFRAHPMNFQNKHPFYQLIKAKWAGEARMKFDEALGNAFHNFSELFITDISTAAFTYSFSTLRPSLFFSPLKMQNPITEYANQISAGGGG